MSFENLMCYKLLGVVHGLFILNPKKSVSVLKTITENAKAFGEVLECTLQCKKL